MPSSHFQHNGHAAHSASPSAEQAKAVKRFFREKATPELGEAFDRAAASADADRAFTLADLVGELLATPTLRRVLKPRRWAKAERCFRDAVERRLLPNVRLAPLLLDLTTAAEEVGRQWRRPRVDPACFLAACLSEQWNAAGLRELRDCFAAVPLTADSLNPRQGGAGEGVFQPLGFGCDLTALAHAGRWPVCPCDGLDREMRLLVTNLLAGRLTALTGEPGVGKTTLAFGLAWGLAQGTIRGLEGCSVVLFTRQDLLAGTADRGRLEKRLQRLFALLRQRSDVIAFFDEMHALLDAADGAGQTVANAIKGALTVGGFRFVGATTDREYNRHIFPDEALHSRFAHIPIPEPDAAAVRRIVRQTLPNHLPEAARAANISAEDRAIDAAVRLTDDFQPTARQPRKAVQLLADAAADRLYERTQAGGTADIRYRLTAEDVARSFSDRSGLPLAELDADPSRRFQALAETLNRRLIGQEHVVAAVVGQLQKRALGNGRRRPQGRFLFLGPSGAGKSLLAAQLAAAWLHEPRAVFEQSLAGYRGEQALNRLFGAPPAYIGYENADTVFHHVAMHPRAVLVFDQVGEADAVLADALLAVLDGQARGANNRVVDFSQTVVIFTAQTEPALFSSDAAPAEIRRTLESFGGFWRATLLDRIDHIAVFHPLGEADLRVLLDRLLEERRREGRQVPVSLSQEATCHELVRRALAHGGDGSARRLETEVEDACESE